MFKKLFLRIAKKRISAVRWRNVWRLLVHGIDRVERQIQVPKVGEIKRDQVLTTLKDLIESENVRGILLRIVMRVVERFIDRAIERLNNNIGRRWADRINTEQVASYLNTVVGEITEGVVEEA